MLSALWQVYCGSRKRGDLLYRYFKKKPLLSLTSLPSLASVVPGTMGITILLYLAKRESEVIHTHAYIRMNKLAAACSCICLCSTSPVSCYLWPYLGPQRTRCWQASPFSVSGLFFFSFLESMMWSRITATIWNSRLACMQIAVFKLGMGTRPQHELLRWKQIMFSLLELSCLSYVALPVQCHSPSLCFYRGTQGLPQPPVSCDMGRERPGHSAGFPLLSYAGISTTVLVYTSTVWSVIIDICLYI